jgi:organic hydroperoxide reductase OsmC/OhrA
VLLIKRIHVKYLLKTEKDNIETAERVHGMHADFCPVARSIRDSIAISTELSIAS